jgi:uncharacterized protein (DUF2147 family)
MLKLFVLCLGLVVALQSGTAYGQTTKGDAIIGTYLTPKKDGKIQIYKRAGKYFGKVITGDRPNELDTKNPEASLRTRKLIGLEILTNFEFDGDDTWEDGKIYDPNEGKTYSCKMTLEGKNLKVRGFIGISLLGRNEIFTRID